MASFRDKIGYALKNHWLLSLLSLLFVLGLASIPGLGILLAFLGILLIMWLKREGKSTIGLSRPASWRSTLIWAMLLGTFLCFFSIMLIDPLIEKTTGEIIDLSNFESIRGNLGVLLFWIVLAWTLAAFVEEIVSRGYLITRIAAFFQHQQTGNVVGLVLSSVLFGLAHYYQGFSGMISTGIMGLIFGIIFLMSGRNLWLPILIHGIVDTISFYLLYVGKYHNLQNLW